MALCHITGNVQLPDGGNAAGRVIVFQRNPDTVVAQSGHGIIPDSTSVRVDQDGNVDFRLYTGNYLGIVKLQRNGKETWFKFPVPEQSEANFQDILVAADPVEPLPSWLQEAFDARDAAAESEIAAEDAAVRAETFGPRSFQSVEHLKQDENLTPTNTPNGSVVTIADLDKPLVAASAGDFSNDAGVNLTSIKFAKPRSSAFITPEEVGVTVAASPSSDETVLLSKALNGAIDYGYALQLNRMYRVGPISIPSSKKGLTLTGYSGMRQKNGAGNDVGLIALAGAGETQSHLLKFGENGVGGDFENLRMDGVTLHGNDATITQGLLWADRLSQCGGSFNTFTRARGPAIMAQKLEDAQFYGTNLVMLGGNDGRAAICFGRASHGGDPSSAFGSNAVRLIGGRMEWIDGPFIGIHPDQIADAWASHVFFDLMKYEVGEHTVDGVTYGSHRADYDVFWFPSGASVTGGNPGHRVSAIFTSPFINNAYQARSVHLVGNVDDYVVTNPQYSLNNSSTLKLFSLEDQSGGVCEGRNVRFIGGGIRFSGGDRYMTGSQITWSNKNRLPIRFDIPEMSDLNGVPLLVNDNAASIRSFSKYGTHPEGASGSEGNYCISDPDPETDPCFSAERSVMRMVGGTSAIRFDQSSNYGGALVGLPPSGSNRSIRIRVRAKKNGVSNPTIYLRDDVTASLRGRAISTTTFSWYEFVVPTSLITKGLRLNAAGTSSSATIDLDVFTLEYVDYSEAEYQVNIPAIAAGARVAVTTDNGGNPLLIPSSMVGDRVEWFPAPQFNGNMQGLIIDPQITSANTMTIYATNPTAAAIDLPGYVGWMFRASSRG